MNPTHRLGAYVATPAERLEMAARLVRIVAYLAGALLLFGAWRAMRNDD